MQVENILSLLNGVRRSGTGWIARCPAHPDRNPSLSVKEGERGVLLRCWAGCTVKTICASSGLRVCDLFFDTAMPRASRSPSPQTFRPDRRRVALDLELYGDRLRLRAETVLSAARGLDCTCWRGDDFDRAMNAVATARHDHQRARVLFTVADRLRIQAYDEGWR